jgi:hypothetical protein
MSYTILKTNGDQLTQIVDGQVDQITTDLTLIGKNSASYGTSLNENFVKLLENFANTSPPNNPIIGQLWFDLSQGRLKVYDGNLFRVSGGALVSKTIPSTIATGDIWIDSTNQQMYFNDGVANILAGPIYTSTEGLSGFQTTTIVDIYSVNHTVLSLYLKKTLIGIFSLDEFTPRVAPSGFSGNITVGFNVSNYSGITFKVPALSATQLIAADGTVKTAENFLNTGDSTGKNTTSNKIVITNVTPLVLGPGQNSDIRVDSSRFSLNSITIGQNFAINVNSGSGLSPAMFVSTSAQQVGIFVAAPTATLDVGGNANIRGNLTVQGTYVTVTTPLTPASSSAAGIPGQIGWDTSYIYVCTAVNTWKRAALTTW